MDIKVVVTATAPVLDARVDPRLDGAAYFTLVNTNTIKAESMPNRAREVPLGTEEAASKAVIGMSAQALISDHVGPKAQEIVSSAGMRYYPYSGGLVEDAMIQLKRGELPTLDELARMKDMPSGVGSTAERGTGPEA